MKPNNATHLIFAILIIVFFAIVAPYLDASAQSAPTETATPTPNCWWQDGHLVCLGPGPVATTATPTVTPVAPTPEETPENRPMNICAHPLFTCVRLPIIHRNEVSGGVQ
jgi:hypothetical protein